MYEFKMVCSTGSHKGENFQQRKTYVNDFYKVVYLIHGNTEKTYSCYVDCKQDDVFEIRMNIDYKTGKIDPKLELPYLEDDDKYAMTVDEAIEHMKKFEIAIESIKEIEKILEVIK